MNKRNWVIYVPDTWSDERIELTRIKYEKYVGNLFHVFVEKLNRKCTGVKPHVIVYDEFAQIQKEIKKDEN